MTVARISVAYMPLVDAAPLIVAREIGFAQAEGVALDLVPAPSWSSVRDMLAFGRVDAAHMLSPVPIALAMGLGGIATRFASVSVLSVNGTVIGVGRRLERALRRAGYGFDFADPFAAAATLAAVSSTPVVFGVPFPFSMHVELLRYWAEGTDLGASGIQLRTVPPPLMAQALAAGDIDAFCVGEPWGSVAVEAGAGALLLPSNAIWAFAPEKTLTVRNDWAETRPDLMGRLVRAVWKAGRWLGDPGARATAADLLSRKAGMDVPAELVDRALSGQLTLSTRGEQRHVERFVEFHHGAASFPWRSQAMWIAERLRQTHGGPGLTAGQINAVIRPDLYRRALSEMGVDLPGASAKIEGVIGQPTAVASAGGRMTLMPDRFFDGRFFDPEPKQVLK